MRKRIKKTVGILIIFFISLTIIWEIINNGKSEKLIINNNILKDMVYIDGAIQNPGIYNFKENMNINNLIELAGGILKDSDLSNIDVNMNIKSGEKIIIPYLKSSKSVEKININTASKSELVTLEGIGEKTADRIVQYRLNNKFKSIDDIMKVEGIGISKFSNIKDKIVVE